MGLFSSGCDSHHYGTPTVQSIEIKPPSVGEDYDIYRMVTKDCIHHGCENTKAVEEFVGTIPSWSETHDLLRSIETDDSISVQRHFRGERDRTPHGALLNEDDWLDVIQKLTLVRGRPEDPCDCAHCDCDLHTYPDDDVCVWCRNDDHGVGR